MATSYLFFSGKGGVGKTSMACTHAVRLAEQLLAEMARPVLIDDHEVQASISIGIARSLRDRLALR